MAVFHVYPEPGDREENPYSAMVGGEDEYLYGNIRITPPFSASEFILRGISDVGVEITHEFTDNNATMLSFNAETNQEWKRYETNQERVALVVGSLLECLGQVACAELFDNEWADKE